MKNKCYRNTILTLIIFTAFLFGNSCKKYPKNYLWFKSPASAIAGRDWTLETYVVSGTDSTNYDDLTVYRENTLKYFLGETQGTFGARDENGSVRLENSSGVTYMSGSWSLDLKKKHFSSRLTSNIGNLNQLYPKINDIFRNKNWEIEKLSRKQFWLSRNENNVLYELHFKAK